eukprot:TRINITY_DN34110_c0_g1_i1.p1 TRINITY_DN34110_c0_g1~~TRINITY_DN34110_c0_g1_i1.p1  ORF type:complete len:319 (-),score=24.93 TRINITY_DN34110_c0_g1_i1:12-968(-)
MLRHVCALVACILSIFLASPKAQSLLVFVQWLNWPPFEWSEPSKPSPSWARSIASYLGPLHSGAFAFDGLSGAEPLTIVSPNGRLRGWRISRYGTGECTILYLHGNAGNIAVAHRVELYKLLARLSCDVIAVDYAGFGFSDGRWPDEETATQDALAILDTLQNENGKVIVWAHSLGTGIVTSALAKMIDRQKDGSRALLPKGVNLEAPFTSVPHVAISFISWLPTAVLGPVSRCLDACLWAHRFQTVDRIRAIGDRIDVVVLHGYHDDVVPYEHGRLVAERANATLHTFERGHDDIVHDSTLTQILVPLFSVWTEQSK